MLSDNFRSIILSRFEDGEDALQQGPRGGRVAGLETIWQMIEATLARLSPADLERTVPPMDAAGRERHARMVEPVLQPYARMWLDGARRDGVVRPAVSLGSIIWGVLEHDIHHRSEISTTLGIHALPVVELDD